MCIEYTPKVALCNKRRHFFPLKQYLNAIHHILFNEAELAGLNLTNQLLINVGIAVETDCSQEGLVVSHC
jgi:hypothetical protein